MDSEQKVMGLKSSLYDQFDVSHLHGLRKRLFISFQEFFNILKEIHFPSVFKKPQKLPIKHEGNVQKADCLFDLSSLVSEIQKESKNENLQYGRKDKAHTMLRKAFQINLIKCYKLAIETIQVCSKNLVAGVWTPVQEEYKKLLQIISRLSSISGKYVYGEMFENKKKESSDLVQYCKDLGKILDVFGNNDRVCNKNINNNMTQTAKKTVNNTKKNLKHKNLNQATKQRNNISTNRDPLYMYGPPIQKKFGTAFAQKLTQPRDYKKQDDHLTRFNIDDIHTAIEDFPIDSTDEQLACKMFILKTYEF